MTKRSRDIQRLKGRTATDVWRERIKKKPAQIKRVRTGADRVLNSLLGDLIVGWLTHANTIAGCPRGRSCGWTLVSGHGSETVARPGFARNERLGRATAVSAVPSGG